MANRKKQNSSTQLSLVDDTEDLQLFKIGERHVASLHSFVLFDDDTVLGPDIWFIAAVQQMTMSAFVSYRADVSRGVDEEQALFNARDVFVSYFVTNTYYPWKDKIQEWADLIPYLFNFYSYTANSKVISEPYDKSWADMEDDLLYFLVPSTRAQTTAFKNFLSLYLIAFRDFVEHIMKAGRVAAEETQFSSSLPDFAVVETLTQNISEMQLYDCFSELLDYTPNSLVIRSMITETIERVSSGNDVDDNVMHFRLYARFLDSVASMFYPYVFGSTDKIFPLSSKRVSAMSDVLNHLASNNASDWDVMFSISPYTNPICPYTGKKHRLFLDSYQSTSWSLCLDCDNSLDNIYPGYI